MKKIIKLTLFIEIKRGDGFFRFEDTEGDIKEVSSAIQEEIKSNLESCESSISRVITGKPKVISLYQLKEGKSYGATKVSQLGQKDPLKGVNENG